MFGEIEGPSRVKVLMRVRCNGGGRGRTGETEYSIMSTGNTTPSILFGYSVLVVTRVHYITKHHKGVNICALKVITPAHKDSVGPGKIQYKGRSGTHITIRHTHP